MGRQRHGRRRFFTQTLQGPLHRSGHSSSFRYRRSSSFHLRRHGCFYLGLLDDFQLAVVLFDLPDLELVVRVVRIIGPHERKFLALALRRRLYSRFELLAISRDEEGGLVHDARMSGGGRITPVTSPEEGAASWRSFARSLGGSTAMAVLIVFSLRAARGPALFTPLVSLPTSGGAGEQGAAPSASQRRRERFSRVLSISSCRTGRPRRLGDSSSSTN